MSCTIGRYIQFTAQLRIRELPDAIILAVTRVSVTDVKWTGRMSDYRRGDVQVSIYIPYRFRSRFGE